MISLIEKLGRFWTTVIATVFAIVMSLAIVSTICAIRHEQIPMIGKINAITSPAIIASIINWFMVGLLLNVRKQEKELYETATYDSLTKLLNRKAFLNYLSCLVNLMQRTKSSLVVLYIDIDYFKTINDTYGHDVGDRVLEYCSSKMQAVLRSSDIVGRVGGEEFVIGMPNTDLNGGMIVAEKLRKSIMDGCVIVDDLPAIKTTISTGISVYNYTDTTDVNSLLKIADMELYNAKRSGRNKICCRTLEFGEIA